MAKNKYILNFSNNLVNCTDIYTLETTINKLIKEQIGIKKISIFSFDETTQKLKFFTKPWEIISEKTQKSLYEKYCLLDEDLFATANNFYSLNNKNKLENEQEIYLPIIKNKTRYGIIHFEIENYTTTTLNDLQIIRNLITLCYVNLTISNKMDDNTNFYNAMKNITKIIESQYEPTYVIPLIGEMIDRFIDEHLIYVFIKTENGYKLAWPKACKQENIKEALTDISIETPFFIMNDMQTGVFGLISENTILGAIVAYSNIDKLTPTQIEHLTQLSKQSAITLQRAYVYAEILEHATLDALTGLNNRRQFETRLSQEIATAKRKNSELCCIMIDVDHFKAVNDNYGHLAGDCVLKGVAQIIKKELREYDIACRYGGEEFVIILPLTSIKEATYVAQRLRKTIEETNIDITEAHLEKYSHLNITISAGVSAFDIKEDTNQSFYQKADAALYDAKNTGRNRVIVYKD